MGVRLAIYVAMFTVKEFLRNSDSLSKFLMFIKDFGFDKVYIENYREGVLLDVDVMAKLRDVFEKDFDVGGGVAIGTWGFGMGRNADWWKVLACISDDVNMDVFEKAVVQQAQVFDEILVDDFWANWCYSEKDLESFGRMFGLFIDRAEFLKIFGFDEEIQRMWALYSVELLVEKSKRIVDRVRDVNRNGDVVLKVAEWREDFLHRGLDLKAMASLFDGIYVGTESREGSFRYGSMYIVDYVKSIVGDKLRGAWFDSYNGLGIPVAISPEIFVEQFWYSFLSGVNEITFFQGLEYLSSDREKHVEYSRNVLRDLKKIENMVTFSKIGLISPAIQIPFRKPYDSYVEDVFGLIGIPVTSRKLDNVEPGDMVLVRENMLKYIDIFKLVDKGVNIFLTALAVEKIAEGILGHSGYNLIGVKEDEPIIKKIVDAIVFTDGKIFSIKNHRRHYAYPFGPVLRTTNKINVYLYAVDGNGLIYPAIYEVTHGNASVFVVLVTRYLYNLLHHFPEIVRQTIRDIVYKAIGVKIDFRVQSNEIVQQILTESSEISNISLIIYNTKNIAVVNNNIYPHYFDIVVDRNKLKIEKIEGSVIGNVVIENIKEYNDNTIRTTSRISRHSFDVIKCT